MTIIFRTSVLSMVATTWLASVAAAVTLSDGAAVSAGFPPLPPVPVPAENPITEEKRVLGKMLFWEEQLSSGNTVACGTCHVPAAGSADPRVARHPGFDGQFFTADDVFGSAGVPRLDVNQNPVLDPTFGWGPQVTPRSAPAFNTSHFLAETLWDGRAEDAFVDPETGATLIASGGALESQSILPILNDVEMAHEGRTWAQVKAKLAAATPLDLATNLPLDVQAALTVDPTYPDLFDAAFGDPAITASRIAFSLATYERTLLPDQTPYDRFVAGDLTALTPDQEQGLAFLAGIQCGLCHVPPMFSDGSFRSLGLRPPIEDVSREAVTGDPADRGKFKVPSLRGVGLRPRFMHHGQFDTLEETVAFYRTPALQFPGTLDPILPVLHPEPVGDLMIDFMRNGLTDPRAAAETFPFDRPTLRSELAPTDAQIASVGASLSIRPAFPNPFGPTTTLSFALGKSGPVTISVFDVRGRRVRTLAERAFAAGDHTVVWDGRDESGSRLGSGVYFYRISRGPQAQSGRLVLER